ncbi:MAG: nucleotidyltransferase domain-containing protein [Crocinitomicaceae bacterium]
MKQRILEKLNEIEREHNVRILFAVESGSRAWGFASPDSDYDIRFVYKQERDSYLGLWESKDTISFMTEDDLDGSGWDLRKALKLLAKSNASLLGWLFSPIVYIDRDKILDELKQLANENFNPVSGFYHYHSMNKGFDELLGSDQMTLKSYFYAMRTALCANWILKNESVPPVEFRKLYSLVDPVDAQLLDELILVKSKAAEKTKESVSDRLIALAKEVVRENNDLRSSVKNQKVEHEEFNRFFIKHIS